MYNNSQKKAPIKILGAQQNNLRNVNVEIPVNRLTVITGVSGSGKSSLAFDTLYAEGQRRYVESLSAYARQFLERLSRPHVREIMGISPTVAIRQKNASRRNPRSTVGTVTEIYDYLRLLYSRVGKIQCRECGKEVRKDTIDEVVENIFTLPQKTRIYVTFPFRESHLDLNSESQNPRVPLNLVLDNLLKQGFHRLIVGPTSHPKILHLSKNRPSSLEKLETSRILLDRLVVQPKIQDRLTDSLELCYREGNGITEIFILEDTPRRSAQILRFTEKFECQHCNIPYRSPEPRLFSFNNPFGACPLCQGFGNTMTLDKSLIIPEPTKTLRDGPIDPFTKPRYRYLQEKLQSWSTRKNIPLNVPFRDLPQQVRQTIWDGDKDFLGVKGFFRYLEKKKYKMHVRILISRYRSYTRCTECQGERLCQEARDVYLEKKRISQLTGEPISKIYNFFSELRLNHFQKTVAEKVLQEIKQRLEFLIKVGLGYLTLERLTSTLSGGEIQRIHLAASLSSSLVGTLYVLDEPSVGLHTRDEKRLIEILRDLRDMGNTIVVVEHEPEMIKAADNIIDMGPGAGENGGQVVYNGNLTSLLKNKESLTAQYMNGKRSIPIPAFRRTSKSKFLTLHGANQHNLKNLSVQIPMGVLVCITGVSGSGKSTLVHDVLYTGLKKLKGEWKGKVGEFNRIEGWEKLGEVLLVDQTPIGTTPRSNPVTYVKAFDEIRRLFASTRAAHYRNFSASHFSFNISSGRCESCQGAGRVRVEMQFLADVELVCEDCKGSRYTKKILEVTYQGKNIAEILEMTVTEAVSFFKHRPPLVRKLEVLNKVGLGYLRLGQPATTLSGGEAQRVKLSAFLSKKTSSNPLFIFDEPTTGLHFDDISKLLRALNELISRGASVLIIEHNLDMIKNADWVIDLGPEGGDAGGQLIAEGPPEVIARKKSSHTGRFLKKYLSKDPLKN